MSRVHFEVEKCQSHSEWKPVLLLNLANIGEYTEWRMFEMSERKVCCVVYKC